MRVEELARRAETSVDTIRFYQRQGILPPPQREGRLAWYSAQHLERLRRVRELRQRGFTLAIIRRFLAGQLDLADEPLVAAVAEAGSKAHSGELLSAEEVSQRTGVPIALLEAVAREGLLSRRHLEGELRFTEGEVEGVRCGLSLLGAGLPLPALLEAARRHDTAVRQLASSAVELFDAHVRKPLLSAGVSDAERAGRLVEAFRVVLPAASELAAQHFRRVLLEAAQAHLESVGASPDELAQTASHHLEEATR
ncbi:MAG: MerR family transcriptional regulator [Acidimicrobiia bacterium]